MTKRQAYIIMTRLLTCVVLFGASLVLQHVAETTALLAG